MYKLNYYIVIIIINNGSTVYLCLRIYTSYLYLHTINHDIKIVYTVTTCKGT